MSEILSKPIIVVVLKSLPVLVITSFLYVSKYTEDWMTEHLENNLIYAYVCCPDSPLDYEVGSIALSSKQGALIRIG